MATSAKIIIMIFVSLVAIVLASKSEYTGEEHPIMAVILELISLSFICVS